MHDRFLFSSDLHKAYICIDCGSLVTPTPCQNQDYSVTEKADDGRPMYCSYCKPKLKENYRASIKHVPMPYVTRFLASELMAMNIRLFFDVTRMDSI